MYRDMQVTVLRQAPLLSLYDVNYQCSRDRTCCGYAEGGCGSTAHNLAIVSQLCLPVS